MDHVISLPLRSKTYTGGVDILALKPYMADFAILDNADLFAGGHEL